MKNGAEKLIHELDQKVISRLSQRKYNDFRQELKDVFFVFKELLEDYYIQNTLGEKYALHQIPFYIEKVKKWCKDIETMVDGHFEGDLLKTVKVYNRLFKKTAGSFQLWPHFPSTNIEQDSLWYRGRDTKKEEHWDKKQLFHVSYEERGKIGSQRFSIQGFPCLYLASSLSCCIKETHAKTFTTVSAFKALSNIEVYDLSFYPSISNAKQLWDYLLLYPIKIACSIPMQKKCKKDNFIPEYIVPEYVLHGTIKQSKDLSKSLGFIYTSTTIFSKNVAKEEVRKHTNLVIPVVEIKNKGYCDILRNMFSMTEPVKLSCSDKNHKFFEEQSKLFTDMEYDKLPHIKDIDKIS